MSKSNSIQIFKPGKRTDMRGTTLDFSESDMTACAAAYDPAKYEAPLVVGHPKHNKPRFGGVASLDFSDGILSADPKDVLPEFAEWVGKKMFPHVSASFYLPTAPGNPVPGVYYLRHVGFLGAQPPAVKGLNEHGISFADDEEGVVVFAEWDDVTNASLWRQLREWFIGKFGQEEADKVIPQYNVQELEQSAQDELRESRQEDLNASVGDPAQFSEGATQVTPEEKAALEAENARLKLEIDASKARDRVAASATRHAAHLSFAEGLVGEGKLLPVNKDVAVATMDFMADQEQVVEFGEGDAKKPLIDALKEFLQAQPKQVEFGEVSGGKRCDEETVNFAAPAGYTVDAARLEIHRKAVAYQAEKNVTYEAALAAVSA